MHQMSMIMIINSRHSRTRQDYSNSIELLQTLQSMLEAHLYRSLIMRVINSQPRRQAILLKEDANHLKMSILLNLMKI